MQNYLLPMSLAFLTVNPLHAQTKPKQKEAVIEADFKTSGEETTGLINEIVNGADVQIKPPKVAAGASISVDNRIGVNSGYSGKTGGKLSGLTVK